MIGSGALREQLASRLNAAYGDGLLSEATLAHRLEQLFGSRLVEPDGLIGDLTLRRSAPTLGTTFSRLARRLVAAAWGERPQMVLGLDWSGRQEELLVGRDPSCDLVLTDPTVSRRHARLRFRDGSWILHDLGSTHGSRVNRRSVVRCRLEPGDRLALGSQRLLVD